MLAPINNNNSSTNGTLRGRSPSLPISPTGPLYLQTTTTTTTGITTPLTQSRQSPQQSPQQSNASVYLKKRKCKLNKVLDIEFMYHLFSQVIDLNCLTANLNKNTYSYYYSSTKPQIPIANKTKTVNYEDCIVAKYIEIMLEAYFENFDCAFKLFKMLCSFEKQLNKLRANANGSAYSVTMVNPQIINSLLTNWLLVPSFICSSKQFKKNYFIKNIIVELILNDLYDPNDCGVYYFTSNLFSSNNLLNHCVQLIFASRTLYQLDLIYDLIRTSIQYGANPNLDPFEKELGLKLNRKCCPLAQLCTPMETNPRLSPVSSNLRTFHHLSNLNYFVNTNCSSAFINNKSQHHHHHHHHHHHQKHHQSQLDAPVSVPHVTEAKAKSVYQRHEQYSSLNSLNQNECGIHFSRESQSPHQIDRSEKHNHAEAVSPISADNNNISSLGLNSGLLLTPKPANNSLLVTSTCASSRLTADVQIDCSLLFLNHYKKIAKLLFDSMENDAIRECLKLNGYTPSHHHHHYHHFHHHANNNCFYQSSQTGNSNPTPMAACLSQTKGAHDSFEMYLEKLTSTPRTLKSIVRRHVWGTLVELKKSDEANSKVNKLHKVNSSVAVVNQIQKLPLPKRVKNFLLFIE